MPRIAIIGLGLIGGSIALALKRAQPEVEVAGFARTRETVQKARRLKAIDVAADSAADAVRGASLVVIASPILAKRAVFAEIADALEPGAVVTDVGSTKSRVMRWAKEILPAHAHFVGGHPMAGKEQAGIDAADADLFQDRPWVIVPSVDADEAAVNTVLGLAQVCGARPIFMDAEEHDSYVAAISHLPLVVASALFSVVFGSTAWPELAQLASSGFRDTTRLASGSPEMAHDIVRTNRDNVLHWIDRFAQELQRFRDVIASEEGEQILEAFLRAQVERDHYIESGPPRREASEQEFERVNFLANLLIGSKLASALQKQEQIIRDAEARAEGKDRKGRP
jgi:prephenate dehydrogenase